MKKRTPQASPTASAPWAPLRHVQGGWSFYDTLEGMTAPIQQLTMEERSRVVQQLRELISALDNRMPQIQRAGEVEIAQDAAAVREKAVARIAELESEEPSPPNR